MTTLRVPLPRMNPRSALRAATITLLAAVATAGLVAVAGVASLAAASMTGWGIFGIPDHVELGDLDQRSVIYAADGSEIAVLHDEVDRRTVALDEVSEHVPHAVLAAEDRAFYEHRGYSLTGMLRAAITNVRAGEVEQGGSTITQQLAKNNVVGSDRTLQRKLDELRYAIALERQYTKDQLLERYLNQVYFGSGAYGIAAAAEEYFRADPASLEPHQAALLAGMIRSPATLDPREDAEQVRALRDAVLEAMVVAGHLTPEEGGAAKAQPVEVEPPLERTSDDPYVVEAVKREFFDDPTFGETRQDRIDLLFTGGLQIHTTLDPRMQGAADEAIAAHLEDPAGPTAAIAAVDPRTGHVLAITSGANFGEEQFDLATQGRRQPGSAFKPFVLAAALQRGVPLRIQLEGNSPAFFDVPGWTQEDGGVRNYGDASLGRVDVRTAMTRSVNTAFAELIMMTGVEPVVATAQRLGIDAEQAMSPQDGPAIALGGLGHGVTPLEMAGAYAVFGNAGHASQQVLIQRVVDRNGREVLEQRPEPERVLPPEVNAAVVDVLRGVVLQGTGRAAAVEGWPIAGKTGTTQNSADAWFVGTTPTLATAVWVGHAEGQVPMDGVTGGSVPARVWHDFMAAALEGMEPVEFPDVDVDFSALEHGAEVEVPDVVGMTEAEALDALLGAQLVGVVRTIDAAAPAGVVVAQTPRGGEDARSGSDVVLSVSSGTAPQASPTPSATETVAEPETTTAVPGAPPPPPPPG